MHTPLRWLAPFALVLLACEPEATAQGNRDAGAPHDRAFHFAFTHDRTYVVLRTRTEPAWGAGPLRLAQRATPTVVVRDADVPASALPPSATRMVLRRGREAACVAELGRPLLLRRAYVPWETVDTWEREGTSDAKIAEELWALVPESELLVAEAVALEGDCAGADWANPARDAPTLAPASISRPRALRAFRRLQDYRGYQDDYRRLAEELGETGPARWEERPHAELTVTTLRSNGRRFALVSALAEPGCGDFSGGLWALFEDTEHGLTLLHSRSATETPVALIDVEGDGIPEVVLSEEIIRGEPSADDSIHVTTPSFICPC